MDPHAYDMVPPLSRGKVLKNDAKNKLICETPLHGAIRLLSMGLARYTSGYGSSHFKVLVKPVDFVPLKFIVESDVCHHPKCQDEISDRFRKLVA